MQFVSLIDIGSTFTKGVLVDLSKQVIVKKHRVPTSIDSGIQDGFFKIVDFFNSHLNGKNKSLRILVSSSAAGGLKIIVVGLSKTLSLKAGTQIAFNAGAKIVARFSKRLNLEDIAQIERINADIILLTGGINGGDETVIKSNAVMLSKLKINPSIMIAGNQNVASEIFKILQESGKHSVITENVLPELNQINLAPVKQTIADLFYDKIIYAKGLNKVASVADNRVIPTPSAALTASQLLSEGTGSALGLGPLLLIDVGGATTDIFSVCHNNSENKQHLYRGLPEPYLKRTVEGDAGLRRSAKALLERVIADQTFEISRELTSYVNMIKSNPEYVPQDSAHRILDCSLAEMAIRISFTRHCGFLKTVHTMLGDMIIQEGKDLSMVKYIIATGGIFSGRPVIANDILKNAIYSLKDPFLLKPESPSFLIDNEYIFSAMGLLAEIDEECAFSLLWCSLFDYREGEA